MNVLAIGSSIVSSYWNGAATYYRGIYKYLAARGHRIVFAEPNAFGRQDHLDEGDFSFVESLVYKPESGPQIIREAATRADVVIKHSGLGVDDALLESLVPSLDPNHISIFWDVDAPATISRIASNAGDPFRQAIPLYSAVLTYGGGPEIERAYRSFGAQFYASIYNGLDPETHHPVAPDRTLQCDVAFLGNRLPDREARVDELFLRAAKLAPQKSFLLGGEGWADKPLPPNVRWIGHVPTDAHNRVNCSAGMVLNINRQSMANSGFSPPTRVFEVAGAGACLLCDDWPGIDDCFEPGAELLVVRSAEDVVRALNEIDESGRRRIGQALHQRAMLDHTYAQRALLAERAFEECMRSKPAASTEMLT